MLSLGPLLVIAQLAAPQHELMAAASASPRPVECRAAPGRAQARGIWREARNPEAARYCRNLARGYAKLGLSPADALESALLAQKEKPDKAEPRVLAGRALLALGRVRPAWERFVVARKQSSTAFDDPGALHDLAMAATLTGHHEAALAAYRVLAPRSGLLASPTARKRAYLEAAAQAMNAGLTGLGEAVGYLAEARRQDGALHLVPLELGLLALAFDREGRHAEAMGAALEARGPWTVLRLAEAKPGDLAHPVLPRGELHAVIAILASGESPDLAREHWQVYIDETPDSNPWRQHAESKL